MLTAANVVEPLVASWDSTPPNTPGSRVNFAGSGMGEVGVACSVSSPSFSCPVCTPTGSFQSSLPVCALSSIRMPALPPSMTTGWPWAVVRTGEFCRSQS